MALTVTTGTNKGRDGQAALAARRTSVVRVTFDSSYNNTGTYATSGEAFDPKQFVGYTPAVVQCVPRGGVGTATSSAGRIFVYDPTNKVIHVYQDTTPAAAAALVEVPNTTDLSTAVIDVICIGD